MERVLRWARENDYEALADVMYDAVRNGDSPYDERQRAAWMPVRRSGRDWTDRLSTQNILLAESDGDILGFMSLAANGYIDFAYIRPEAQGKGLFRQLLEQIVEKARSAGDRVLWVHASLSAEPAFSAFGFRVRKREEVMMGAERLERFEMEKALEL